MAQIAKQSLLPLETRTTNRAQVELKLYCIVVTVDLIDTSMDNAIATRRDAIAYLISATRGTEYLVRYGDDLSWRRVSPPGE